MPDNEDKLLDIAFKAEKRGDRIGAIRLYQQIANGTSEHSTYAKNCVERLEELGVSAQAETELPNSSSEGSVSNSDNPFEAPANPGLNESAFETDYDSLRRIQISTIAVRGVSVFCLVAAALSFSLLYFGNLFELDTMRSRLIVTIDYLNTIALVVVAYCCWKYSSALQQLLPVSNRKIGNYSKRHCWLWIGISTLALLRVAREMMFFISF